MGGPGPDRDEPSSALSSSRAGSSSRPRDCAISSDALTPLPYPRDGAGLVETGVYARVRHPIYGGLVLAAFGWGLLAASPVAIALAAVLLGFFELKSRREEVWLAERFPGYPAYRERTRRLIPWIG